MKANSVFKPPLKMVNWENQQELEKLDKVIQLSGFQEPDSCNQLPMQIKKFRSPDDPAIAR
jgi:hypothetical protein